jgi:ElaA protein
MPYRWQIADFAQLCNDTLYTLLQLRQEVFVVEQACIYQDLDNLDQLATHMLCWEGGTLRAYQRCLRPGLSFSESSIGRIVVAPGARGTGLGRDLVRLGVEHNLARWPESGIRINAQAYLSKFYSELGFDPVGDEYDEDGIMHQQMVYRSPSRGTD